MSEQETFAGFGITVCGIEELEGFCETGVSHVLSILDPGWPEPPAFGAYGEHERLELRFHDIIDERSGMLAPSANDVARILGFGRDLVAEVRDGAHLLVHCHMGISRSTAAMTLILAQARPDAPPETVIDEVRRIRPKAWPNLRLMELGDAALGRDGALLAALREHYRRTLEARPRIAQSMAELGRQRELIAGGWSG